MAQTTAMQTHPREQMGEAHPNATLRSRPDPGFANSGCHILKAPVLEDSQKCKTREHLCTVQMRGGLLRCNHKAESTVHRWKMALQELGAGVTWD